MKLGIITDIHANRQALEVVLRVLEAHKVDYVACLGDIVGYGGEPDICCTLVRQHADVTVVGNHDAAVANRMAYGYYRESARQALDLHRRLLSDDNLAWLSELPYVARQEDILFSHGMPVNPEEFEYLFALEQMGPMVHDFERQARVTFVGHSHLCKSFDFDAREAREVLRTRFKLAADRKYIISAGSVGQPRDYDARACCGIYDTDEQLFQYVRLDYDIEGAARTIVEAELSPAFGRRLFLGV